jgi:hypothetical protein
VAPLSDGGTFRWVMTQRRWYLTATTKPMDILLYYLFAVHLQAFNLLPKSV